MKSTMRILLTTFVILMGTLGFYILYDALTAPQTSTVVGTYYVENSEKASLSLNSDGTFVMGDGKTTYQGTYRVEGNSLIVNLELPKDTFKLDGKTIVMKNGLKWVKK